MGNRATCPVCNSYSSSVLADIENGHNCRTCGCPNDFLEEYQLFIERKESFIRKNVSKGLVNENDDLI